MRHYIKRPGHGRVSYALMGPAGIVKDPRIVEINRLLKLGEAKDILEMRLTKIKRDYDKPTRDSELVATGHAKLVSDCFKYRVARKSRGELVDPRTIRYYLEAGAKVAAGVDLATATIEDLKPNLDKVKTSSLRLTTIGLNALLKHVNNPIRFSYSKPELDEVVYLEIEEFTSMVRRCSAVNQVLLKTLYATGARYGEAFALSRVVHGAVHIGRQIRVDGKPGPTKNRKFRTAYVLEEFKGAVLEWVSIPEKAALRNKMYDSAYLECKEHLGIRIHDLRHSYAVRRGQCGAGIETIAKAIGDTIDVCARYYRNHCLTNKEIELEAATYKSNMTNLPNEET